MSQAFHFVQEGEITKDRRPSDPASGRPYDSAVDFGSWEESDFLNRALPCMYGVYSTDQPQQMRSMLQRPFEHMGRLWRPWFLDARDTLKAVLIPNEVKGNLELARLRTHMTKTSDVVKVSKYMRRLFAAHKRSAWAYLENVQEVSDGWIETVRLEHNDALIRLRHFNLDTFTDEAKAHVDGQILQTARLLREVYSIENPRYGFGDKPAWIGGVGVVKGFGHLLHGEYPFDAYVYGPKTVLTSDRVYFGDLGDLNPGVHARTDIQMIINFFSHRPDIIVKLVEDFGESVLNAFLDEDKMVEMLLSHLNVEDEDLGDDAWVLLKALRMDLGFQWAPGLARRVWTMLMDKVLDCGKLRIPLDGHAVACDVQSSPEVIGDDGRVDVSLCSIPKGYCCAPDVPEGPVALLRSPNGNPNEAMILTNKHFRRFRKYRGMRRVFVGASLKQLLKVCGGADLDDRFVVIHDQGMVQAISERIGTYPVVAAEASIPEKPARKTRFSHMVPGFEQQLTQYGPWHFHYIVDCAEDGNIGVGRIVNPLMLDVSESGPNRQPMIDNLKVQIADAKDKTAKDFLEAKLAKFEVFPHYALAKIGNNLERWIDAIKKEGTSTQGLAAELNHFMGFDGKGEGVPVFPRFWVELGKLPKTLKDKGDYAVAESPICIALNDIRQIREELEVEFNRMQHRMVSPLPEKLVPTVIDDTVYDAVSELRQWWYKAWVEAREKGLDIDGVYDRLVHGPGGVEEQWRKWAKPIRMAMAVELASRLYDTEHVDGDGSFPDGLLWTRPIGNDFLDAIQEAGMTGWRIPVDTKGVRLTGETIVDVLPVGSWNCVFRCEDRFLIGEVPDAVPAGEYTMQGNLLLVQESDRYFRTGLKEKANAR